MSSSKYILVLALISAVSCNEFIILNSPKSIDFKGSSSLTSDSVSEVLAASLGYSVSGSNWDGLFVNDPFNTAKGVLSVVVEGVESLDFKDAKTYNLIGDYNFEDALHSKVLEHSDLAVDVDIVDKLDEPVITPFGELLKSNGEEKVHYMKPKLNKYDMEFLNQIAAINSLTHLLKKGHELPTALTIKVSLKMLVASHSDTSSAVKEAKKMLVDSIEKLSHIVEKVSEGSSLFTVITVDEHHQPQHRSKRQAEVNTYNLAVSYGKDYPVMFNIIFWFTIIFLFSLLAISLSLANMEDKDSIIYRLTSRNKKDN
ncbi:unnamed protein product [Diamesa serratosioi]